MRAGHESGDVCDDSVVVLRRKLGEVEGYLDRLTDIRDQLRRQLAQAIAHREPACWMKPL